MSTLANIQAVFCAGLDPFGEPRQQAAAADLIQPHGTLDNARRLDIYRRNVSAAHVAVLELIFPVCRMIVGELGFAAVARAYTWDQPSPLPDLNRYGGGFPRFLQDRLGELPYLHDLAALEYHWHQALFVADAPAFDFPAFAQASRQPDRLVFTTAPGLCLLHSEWPVLELWDRHRAGEAPSEIRAGDQPDSLVIARTGLESGVTRIEEDDYRLLEAVLEGLSLTHMSQDSRLQHTVERLPGLITRGWICGFLLRDDDTERERDR